MNCRYCGAQSVANDIRLLKNPLAKLIRKIEWMGACSEVKVNEYSWK